MSNNMLKKYSSGPPREIYTFSIILKQYPKTLSILLSVPRIENKDIELLTDIQKLSIVEDIYLIPFPRRFFRLSF